MKVEMFISSLKGISPEDVMDTLIVFKVLANVTVIHSSVYNKKADAYTVEKGVKVDIFNIAPENLINLWVNGFKNREDLGLHCAWINTPDHNGCILNTNWYSNFCRNHHLAPEKCSEY